MIGIWYLLLSVAPIVLQTPGDRPVGLLGSFLLGGPALGLMIAPERFIRLMITVACFMGGLALPVALVSGSQSSAWLGFALIVAPVLLLVGARRRLFSERSRLCLAELQAEVHGGTGQRPAPPTLADTL